MEDQDILYGKDNETVRKLFSKIQKELSTYSTKADIKINRQEITHTTLQLQKNPNNDNLYRPSILNKYDELLKNKVPKGNIKNQVIKYAELTIQPTCYSDLLLFDNKGVVAVLKVISTLPDYAQYHTNYWTGRKIDKSDFKEQVAEFQQASTARYNTGQVLIITMPTRTTTLTRTDCDYTFT